MTSKLEELIAELCPNGVEYKKIGDIATLSRGKVMSKSFINDNSGEYPVYSSQTENNGQFGAISTYMFDGKYVTWTTDGANAGTVFYRDGKFNVTNVCGVIDISDCQVDTKYVYYALTIHAKNYVSSGMGNAKLMSNVMSKVTIPIPPLEVQSEIVRILDTFTEFTAELTAELTARKKQYGYYRDTLLTFDDNNPIHSLISRYCPNGVEYKNLKELGSFFGGLTGKNKNDFVDGNARYITYKNVYCNAAVDFSANDFVKVSDGEKQNVLQYGDVIFTGSSETPDECGFSSAVTCHLNEEVYLNSFCFAFRFNDVSVMNPDFSKYLFRSTALRSQIKRTANGVTRFNVSKALMGKVTIPVPPLEVQRQIVQILDRFDALCNDLTQGLPAEIEARRKQYEYYRDQLLTFKRA